MENKKDEMPKGLTTAKAQELLKQYGRNELKPQKRKSLILKLLCVMMEPMFLLLMIAAVIYFLLGEPGDGAVMLLFVTVMITIDAAQELRTDRTLQALRELSAPQVTVIRDGVRRELESGELVPGDVMLAYEGVKLPADGRVLACSDFCIDESSLTGEADRAWKRPFMGEGTKAETDAAAEAGTEKEGYWKKTYCYKGTLVLQGTACIQVEKTGAATEYAKVGAQVNFAAKERSPLKWQIRSLVTVCAWIAAALFLLVTCLTYWNLPCVPFKNRLIQSVLSGVTLAMAMIPEEFPVILTVFLSMGAWRLAKKRSLIRRLSSVETLGAISVLCVDKTGTITTNHMEVKELWEVNEALTGVLGLACETDAYDPMEIAMLKYCEQSGYDKEFLFCGTLLKEYAFNDEEKMMGHVWERDGKRVLAVKGSPEAILDFCRVFGEERKAAEVRLANMAGEGLRVIGAAAQELLIAEEPFPRLLQYQPTFLGFIGLWDPPREGIKKDISSCKRAGIRTVMITGDNGITAAAIAKQTGISLAGGVMTGAMLDQMKDQELREVVKRVSVYSRVIPEHKLRIVKALKEGGEIVAMTGDGVNDAPALIHADIGIAMGRRGSQVSREAADLILMDDNFSTIVETIGDGRRIYDNMRKAVDYVFTIHIPIACASLAASFTGTAPASFLFLPVHIVLMELIIDPTCSVVLERQPAHDDVMTRNPRRRTEKLLKASSLRKSIRKGLVLFAASFGSYYVALSTGHSVLTARSMGVGIVILSNLFLVAACSSECRGTWNSVKKLSRDKAMWLFAALVICLFTVSIYSPLHVFLGFEPLSLFHLLAVVALSAVSALW